MQHMLECVKIDQRNLSGMRNNKLYTSIFERQHIVTKRDLCAILHLDPGRPGLRFTAQEINTAYRARVRRLHSDRQARYTVQIDKSLATTLMDDVKRARDHLLKGEVNVPGKKLQKTAAPTQPKDVVAAIIAMLNSLKKNTPQIKITISLLSKLSNSLVAMFTLASYSDGRLNARLINVYSDTLNLIRPVVKHIDGSLFVALWKLLKQGLTVSRAPQHIDSDIKAIEALVPAEIKAHKQYPELLELIKETHGVLTNLLDNTFISQVEHTLRFWPALLYKLPSFAHIISIDLMMMLMTATTIPKLINGNKEVFSLLYQQKGLAALLITGPFLLVLNIALLPVNLGLQVALAMLPIVISAIGKAIYNAMEFTKAITTVNPAKAIESMAYLTVALVVNTVGNTLDAMCYYLTDTHPLAKLLEAFNTWLASKFAPSKPTQEKGDAKKKQLVKVESEPTLIEDMPEPIASSQQTFFPGQKLFADTDPWLDEVLENCKKPDEEPCEESTAVYER